MCHTAAPPRPSGVTHVSHTRPASPVVGLALSPPHSPLPLPHIWLTFWPPLPAAGAAGEGGRRLQCVAGGGDRRGARAVQRHPQGRKGSSKTRPSKGGDRFRQATVQTGAVWGYARCSERTVRMLRAWCRERFRATS
eukprot:4047293-Pyramimonas_sp.AAC.1